MKKNLIKRITILTIIGLLSLVGALAQPAYGGCGMMGYGYNGIAGFGTGMMLFGFAIWTLVIAALILFIIFITKQINKR